MHGDTACSLGSNTMLQRWIGGLFTKHIVMYVVMVIVTIYVALGMLLRRLRVLILIIGLLVIVDDMIPRTLPQV